MIKRITRAYVRHYSDNGQTKAYVEWLNHKGVFGRTEGDVGPCPCCGMERVASFADGRKIQLGPHMAALFARAEREGVDIEQETW